jgi:hypothetical protein
LDDPVRIIAHSTQTSRIVVVVVVDDGNKKGLIGSKASDRGGRIDERAIAMHRMRDVAQL